MDASTKLMSSYYKDNELVKIDGYYRTSTGYNYSHLIFYEKFFFSPENVRYLQEAVEARRNWGLIISISYILVIFCLQKYMKNRERYEMKGLLIVWNWLLAIFSIIASARILPELYHVLRTQGFYASLCNDDVLYGVFGHWSYAYTMSKIPELLDTIFVVLRKHPLIFLHYFHHATILHFVYYWYPQAASTALWFGTMNYFVHSFMYSYYALKAMRVYVPKFVSMFITAIQIIQKIAGLFLCMSTLYVKQ